MHVKKAQNDKWDNWFYGGLGWTWIITWFLSIWITPFRIQFFLTGLFSLALIILFLIAKTSENVKRKKCPYCGMSNPSLAVFCWKCGKRFVDSYG